MVTELRIRNQSQQLYIRALSSAWRNGVQLWDPSIWLAQEADIEEKMLRDADIAHAVGYRRHLIAGNEWNLSPKFDGHPLADLSVSVGTDLVRETKHFTSALLNLSRAFFSGSRFGVIQGEHRVMPLGDGKKRVWWVPVGIKDIDKRRYRTVPKLDSKGGHISSHWEKWHVGAAEWRKESVEDAMQTIRHVYQDDEATLGHGRALREALGWWWYAKTHVFGESLAAVERFAQGILSAKVDGIRDAATGKPNTELIADWQAVLEDMRSRHVLVYDKNDEVEFVKMDGQGWQLLSDIRQELRSSIFTLVLGANLTTSADKGGSYGLAEIQENSTEALIQFDRGALAETMTDDFIGCIWHKNYANMRQLGIDEQMPSFVISQEKKNDPQEVASVATSLNAMGVDLSMDDVLKRTGFKKPEDDEGIIVGKVAPEPGVGGIGGFGFGKANGVRLPHPSEGKYSDMDFRMNFGGFDESKVKRDKGRFSPKEGSGGGDEKDDKKDDKKEDKKDDKKEEGKERKAREGADRLRDDIKGLDDSEKERKDKEHIDDTTNEVLAQIDSDGIDHVDKNAEDIIDELHRDSGRLDREVVSNIVYDEVDKVRDQIRDQNKEQQKANGKS